MNQPSSDASFYLDPTLYYGRPSDETGRLAKELRTYDLLDQLQIPYWRLVTMPPLQSKPVMMSISAWISKYAKICSCAMLRKQISIF